MNHEPVDPDRTAQLRTEAAAEGPTPAGYFLGKAADATTQQEREYWMRRVDGARYMARRQASLDYLSQRARENMEAELRLAGTEASLTIVRIVGNAVVLQPVPGAREPDGGYVLVGRVAGEEGTTSYGRPIVGQWTVQGLRMDTEYEFCVVSEDAASGAEVAGPWCSVPIGSVSTAAIQAKQREAAGEQYRAAEAAEAERQREQSARAARERKEQAEALERQRETARIERERMDRERLERERIHEQAVRDLPLVGPRDLKWDLFDQGLPTMTLRLAWRRGEKMAMLFQTKVNGSVLGYSGEYDGVKPDDHVYVRLIQVPRGQPVVVEVYAVTKHGDSSSGEITIDVPQSIEPPDPERVQKPPESPPADPEPANPLATFVIVPGIAFGSLVGWMEARNEGTLVSDPGALEFASLSGQRRVNGLIGMDRTLRLSMDEGALSTDAPARIRLTNGVNGKSGVWVRPHLPVKRALGMQVDYMPFFNAVECGLIFTIDERVTVDLLKD